MRPDSPCLQMLSGHKGPSHIGLPAGDDADELDAIAFREFALRPFALMKRGLIVLDENAVRLQAVMVCQFGHGR